MGRKKPATSATEGRRVDLDGERPAGFSVPYWDHLQSCRRGRYVMVVPMPLVVEDIYRAYPRHVGKVAALAAINKAIGRIGRADAATWLLSTVQAFAKSNKGQSGQFCPHPATWMNQGRYDDDQAEWHRLSDPDGSKRVARIEAPEGKYDGIGEIDHGDGKAESKAPAESSPGVESSAGGGEIGRQPGEW